MKQIIAVRPSTDGKWLVVKTTKVENFLWRCSWRLFWLVEGKRLAAQNPTWWVQDYPELPSGLA